MVMTTEQPSLDYAYGRRGTWQPTEFTLGAIEAAFFTCDPFISSGEYHMDWGNWNAMSFSDRKRFVDACEAFEQRFPKILAAACDDTGNDMQHAGRDYYYTSVGHGCGFWDGDWKGERRDYGDLLTKASKRHPLPELHAHVDCHDYRETGSACCDCAGCEAGAEYSVE